MRPKCSCGGTFVNPADLGFDSDGSILVCNGFKGLLKKAACTNSILADEAVQLAKTQRKIETAKQFKIIKAAMFFCHFVAVIPFLYGVPLWEAVLFVPLVYWDIVILKEWFVKRRASLGVKK